MRFRKALAIGLGTVFAVGILLAREKGEVWEKPFTGWDQAQTTRVFNDSPWVRTWGYSTQTEGEHGSPNGFSPPAGAVPSTVPAGQTGTRETTQTEQAPPTQSHQDNPASPVAPSTVGVDIGKDNFTVRLFSAQPVREAFVRMLQLMNKYDLLSPERKQDFDSKIGGLATANPGNEVTVAVAYHSSDPQRDLDLRRYFGTGTTATFSQAAYLYSSSAGQVTLKTYIPPTPTLGCRFVFPRTQANGEPILKRGDKLFRFELFLPSEGNQKLYVEFKPSKLMFNGALSY
jgi:hypothetical protein